MLRGILRGTEGLLCLRLQGSASLLLVQLHRDILQGTAGFLLVHLHWGSLLGTEGLLLVQLHPGILQELKPCYAYICSGVVVIFIVGHLAGN